MLLLALVAGEHVGSIEFFGYKGIDVARVREALPVREGGEFTGETIEQVRQAVIQATGKAPTDIAAPCCVNGNHILFIGLPGASNRQFVYNAPPSGDERLPPYIMDLHRRFLDALLVAVRKGTAQEDRSKGYSLVEDPTVRSIQRSIRRWAVKHEREVFQALERSSDAEHRQVASLAAGYARQSPEQIRALVRAARDPNDTVRNNATRALGVLVASKASLAAQIEPEAFIDMLNSGAWTDRNKALMLLAELTAGRDPNLLARIRSRALDALAEMAAWHGGYERDAQAILERVRQ
ncbi:MAG: HEAT repeat domain-containing protein [Acidobacteriota bacterium]